MRSHITRYDLLRVSTCVCCEIIYHRGYDFLLASASVFCEIIYYTGSDLLRASVCVCCEIQHHRGYDLILAVVRSHITGGTICYGHRPVYVVRSRIIGG